MSPLFLPLLLALPAADPSELDQKILDRLNAYRKMVGVPPVKVDPALSKDCTAHAVYLTKNIDALFKGELNSHDEDPKREGYTPGGKKVARISEIAQGLGANDATWGVEFWMASFLHRVSLLDPGLERVGLGTADRAGKGWALVVDIRNGRGNWKPAGTDGYQAVLYPVDQQKDVPRVYGHGGPELPNPIPGNGESKNAGHPITVTFFTPLPRLLIRNAVATLTDAAGKEVPVWLSWPEKPAVKGFEMKTICLIPKAPLEADTTYSVKVTARVGLKDWSKSWSFTTGR